MRSERLQRHVKLIFGIIAILYPFLVFCSLVIIQLPVRYLSVFFIILALSYIIINRHSFKGRQTVIFFITPVILCTIGTICLLTTSQVILKLYPALANLAYLTFTLSSLIIPPPIAFYFIDIFDKKIKTVIPEKRFNRYCRNATITWCVYFIIDGSISVFSVFWLSDLDWGIYNGGITYVLMGLIFVAEFVILKKIEKKYRNVILPEKADVNS